MIWTNAPVGIKIRNCQMFATLHDIGAYYTIIDLDTRSPAHPSLRGRRPLARKTLAFPNYPNHSNPPL